MTVLRSTPLWLVRRGGAVLLCALLVAGGVPSESVAGSRSPSAPTDTTNDPRVQKYLLKGTTEAQLGDYEEAILYLESALDRAPRAPALLQALADAHEAQGDYATALFYARQARKHGNGPPRYHRRLAELQRQAGQPQDALQTYKDLVARFPEHPSAYRALADLQVTLGRPTAALDTYRTLLEQTAHPSVPVYQRMLTLYRKTGNSRGITETLQTLVERRPNSRKYRRLLGEHYADEDRPEKALDLLAPLAEQRPDDATLQRQVRQLSRKTGRETAARPDTPPEPSGDPSSLSADQLVQRAKSAFDAATSSPAPDSTRLHKAEDLLRKALDRAPAHVAARTLLAQIRQQAGKYRKAGQILERVLEENPRDAGRWAQAADAYLKSNRFEKAASIAEEGLLLFPGHFPLAQTAAFARLRSGDPKRAVDHFQHALSLQGDGTSSPAETASLRAGLGLAYTQLDRPEDADAAFETARSTAPDHPEVLRTYAYSLALRATHLDRALEAARRAVDQSPENPVYLDTLGWVYFQRDNLEAARRQLQKALDAGPPSPRILEHFGDVHHAMGNDATARKYWQKALDRAPDRTSLREKLDEVPTS